MARVYIHPLFHAGKDSPSERVADLDKNTSLRDILKRVCGSDEALHFRIVDERGELRPHVAVFIGDQHCKYLGGIDAPVDPGSEVSVFPALSGG